MFQVKNLRKIFVIDLLFSLHEINNMQKKSNCYRDKNDRTPNASTAEILIESILPKENQINLSPYIFDFT